MRVSLKPSLLIELTKKTLKAFQHHTVSELQPQ